MEIVSSGKHTILQLQLRKSFKEHAPVGFGLRPKDFDWNLKFAVFKTFYLSVVQACKFIEYLFYPSLILQLSHILMVISFNLLCPVLNVEIAEFEPVTTCSAAYRQPERP